MAIQQPEDQDESVQVMGRQLTDQEVVMAMCNRAMSMFFTKGGALSPRLDTGRRREWVIWAARDKLCPTCKVPAFFPCINLLDKKKGLAPDRCRANKTPHDERIDWEKLLEGLKKRGYWRESIRREIRREIARRA